MKLKDLKAQIPRPPKMEDDDGKAWHERLAKANKRHEEQMGDAPILASLYAKPYTTINTKDGVVVVKIPWAKAYLDNLLADIYFKNPDPWIEPKETSDIAKTVARGCRQLAKTLDDDLRTSDLMHRAILSWGTSGFGGIWVSHEQDSHPEPTGDQAVDENGEPTFDEQGQPVPEHELVADDQRLKQEFIDACDYRFDPAGTDWLELSDFKWIARIYTRSLADMIADSDYDNPDVIAQLVYYAAGWGRRRDGSASSSLDLAARDEDDIRYIDIRMAEVWSAVEGQIIHVPLDARFTLAKYPWPRALLKNRRYPTRLISDGYTIKTRDDDNPYPVPLLRHIRALLEDYVRIYDRLLNAGGGIVKRYFTYKNVLERTTFKKWANSDETDIFEIDPEKVRGILGVEDGAANLFQWLDKMLALQPSRDTKEEIVAYGAMLDRIERILWETTGQGPADRGGMPISATATDSANIRAQLDKRVSVGTEKIADAYDDLNEIKFLFIATNQTLPIPYRVGTTLTAEPVWQQFQADMIRGVRLSFTHGVGSSRPPSRGQAKAERMELFGKIAPFFDKIRTDPFAAALVRFAIEPHDAVEVEEILRQMNGLTPMAEECLKIGLALHQRQIDPASPQGLQASARMVELAMTISKQIVGPAGEEAIATGEQQAAPAAGNVANNMTPGQRSAATAAAGASIV